MTSPASRATLVRCAALLGAVLVFMAVSAWACQPWWELAFRSDNSPVSWLSSALLVAAALLAVRLAGDGSVPRVGGSGLAAVLFLLALDEQFQFHEHVKYHWLPRGSPLADWNNVLLIVGGLWLLGRFRRLVRERAPRALMSAAIAVGVLALAVAIGRAHAPSLLVVLEEGLEVLAETLFLCALLELRPPRAPG